MPYPFSRGEILRAEDVNSAIAAARVQGHVFDWIDTSRHAGLTAGTDTDPLDEDIQAAIDDIAELGGGSLVFPPMHAKIANPLVVSGPGVALVGAGSSTLHTITSSMRADAATRLYWDTSAAVTAGTVASAGVPGTLGTSMVTFKTPENGRPCSGGGMSGIMLDGMATCPVVLAVVGWQNGEFRDVLCYGGTEDQLAVGPPNYAVASGASGNAMRNRFIGVLMGSAGNTPDGTWYTTNEARGLRLFGRAERGWNACFNEFIACTVRTAKGIAWVLENSDNNYFFGANGGNVYSGPDYTFVFGSTDWDTMSDASSDKGTARHNFVYGLSTRALLHAGTVDPGGRASRSNLVFGYSRANGAANPDVEDPATDPVLDGSDYNLIFTTNNELFGSSPWEVRVRPKMRARLTVGSTNNMAIYGEAREAALVVADGSQNHLELISGDTNGWGLQVRSTGDLRILRTIGTGGTIDMGSHAVSVQSISLNSGGNARGTAAVDWQITRAAATQVASGDYAVIAGGRDNRADAEAAWVPGGQYGHARAMRRGVWAFSKIGSNAGTAQSTETVLYAQTTDATPTRATTDGAAADSANTLNLPTTSITEFVRIMVVARQVGGSAGTTGTSAAWETTALLRRAGSLTFAGGGTGIAPSLNDASAATWLLDVAIDNTNNGIAVTVTGEANKTINWVARVIGVETAS